VPSLITNRRVLMRVAAATLEQIQAGAIEGFDQNAGLESTKVPVHPNAIANALSGALEWARLDQQVGATAAALESIDSDAADIPYVPNNQVLALLQSAYDEYVEAKAAKQTSELETPFDTSDPGWLTVAVEKLKEFFRGKHKFIKHTTLTSFRHDLPANAIVALFADWGTGEPTAQRVMQQIKARNPTHAIHLGDVYYSGTPKEVQNRFLNVIDQFGPPPSACKYFALNSNHEMYSGGFGYFDTTLPRFCQEASYFCLTNQDWRLIGIDSGYEDHGLQDPQKEWLAAQLQPEGPKNILLSHHQLFSPYESVADKRLPKKMASLLATIYAWFWGHEHKCIILGDHLGIKARCIGHAAIPDSVPYGAPRFGDVPIVRVDERRSPDGVNVHGFALLKFAGSRLDVSYIDEFGTEFFTERLDLAGAPAVIVHGPETESVEARPAAPMTAAQYKRVLKRRESLGGGLEGLEGAVDAEPDLSQPAIKDRAEGTAAELHRIVKELLGDRPDLHEVVDLIAKEGRDSLETLANENRATPGLEVIVRADGSRPSFMIRNGAVDKNTSPVGAWADQLDASAGAGLLTDALGCVGRIDLPDSSQGFEGTGFLIHENLIVTNRHVLQAVARPNPQGEFNFRPGVTIDFGHEFRARDSVSPRRLKRVVFCPTKVINAPIDHTKLDLVLIELEPVQAGDRPRSVLALDVAPDWATPSQFVYTVGYPGNPGLGEALSLLEQLFQSTFGCKRLAPGEIQPAHTQVFSWTLAHDSSTLGGNSGSVLLVPGREGAAAGLHYGGTRADPRENWGHVLGRVLGEPDRLSGKSLRELLNQFGVQLVDRRSS
jgi:hypothetical protein